MVDENYEAIAERYMSEVAAANPEASVEGEDGRPIKAGDRVSDFVFRGRPVSRCTFPVTGVYPREDPDDREASDWIRITVPWGPRPYDAWVRAEGRRRV